MECNQGNNNKPIELWNNKVFDQKLEYIHNNPVAEGFVEKPYFWKYSSVRNYMLNVSSFAPSKTRHFREKKQHVNQGYPLVLLYI